MFHTLPFFPFFRLSRKVVGLPIFSRQISTKNSYRLQCLKLNEKGLLAAGNEDGVLAIFNLLSEVDGPQQVRLLGFETGGVSDLFWIDAETLAVGTTRGWLVVYSMKNQAARFSEVCNVKAHGDGVSHTAVENIDYCPTTQTLVTVGEGVSSIKLWKYTAQDGRLAPQSMSCQTTAYQVPRFVSFTDNGSKLMIGYLQNALVQTFSVQPWTLVEEHILGHDDDANERSHLGNASLLENSKLLAIFNLTTGLDFYDASTFVQRNSTLHPVCDECNQGIAILRGGSYLASAARDGVIHVVQTQDASIALKLKVPGRGHEIDAIHASNCGNCEFLVASSCMEGKPSILTVWCSKEVDRTGTKQNQESGNSTFRLVILCIAISFVSHFIVSTAPLVHQEILARFADSKAAHSYPDMSKSESGPMQESMARISQPQIQTARLTPHVRSAAIRERGAGVPENERSLGVIVL